MPLDSNGSAGSEDREAVPADEEPVCYCMVVSRARLEQAVREGARTIRELSRATGAGTGCGTCRIDLAEVLREAGVVAPAQDSPPPGSGE